MQKLRSRVVLTHPVAPLSHPGCSHHTSGSPSPRAQTYASSAQPSGSGSGSLGMMLIMAVFQIKMCVCVGGCAHVCTLFLHVKVVCEPLNIFMKYNKTKRRGEKLPIILSFRDSHSQQWFVNLSVFIHTNTDILYVLFCVLCLSLNNTPWTFSTQHCMSDILQTSRLQ